MKSVAARLRSLDSSRLDALLAALFAVEAIVETFVLLTPPGPRAEAAAVALILVLAGAIVVRRRWPLVSTIGAWAVFVLVDLLPHAYSNQMVSPLFVVLLLAFSAGRHLDDARAAVAVVIGSALVAVGSGVDSTDDSLANVLASVGFAVVAPMLIGRFMRHRAALHVTLQEKTARLERERRERAEEAASDERTRIAGELHDVVAHALSAMVVQGGVARRLATSNPQGSAAAFAAVEGTGREALTEIRSLLGVLRREDEELGLAPQPSLRHLTSLVARTRAAGLPVELALEGDERPLTAGVDLTAYRVVQEALRSAIEQGHAGRAEVLVRYGDEHVDVRVADDGPLAPARELPGVRERVTLYGGQLMAGAGRDGAHRVRARLPVGGAA